jgi:hypothetical protein
MPFFRPLNQTAPAYIEVIPWPIAGLAYVVAFMGPLGGSLAAGVTTKTWSGALLGLIVGVAITWGNAWLNDTFIDRWLAKFQHSLNGTLPRVFINVIAFSWAIGLCAVSMLTTWAILSRMDIFPH